MNPDETTPQEMDINEAVATLLRELPKPVQDFVTGPERARVALSLSQKYNLHADQAGEFEHAFMFMLLGISSPEEFVDSLTRAGILPEMVRGLVADVNEQVFVPLRKAEQNPTPAPTVAPAPSPIQPAMPPASKPLLATPAPAAPLLPGSSEPVPVATPFPPQPASIPVVPPVQQPQAYPQMPPYPYGQPAMPPQMMYPTPPPYGVPYGAPVYMWPQQPVPQWSVQPSYAYPPQAPQYMPAPEQQAAPTSPAPAPAINPAPTVAPAPSPHAQQQTPPPTPVRPVFTPQSAPAPLKKDYGADPYREPFN
ncbi:MAG: hypothetical protein KA104_02925 [Candidatus Pacebacteria bacterium]|nr:hypothetical protein [Candidatus Paceibacterota bacterium]